MAAARARAARASVFHPSGRGGHHYPRRINRCIRHVPEQSADVTDLTKEDVPHTIAGALHTSGSTKPPSKRPQLYIV